MDKVPRILAKTIKKYQKKGFINLIYGPRQVGKTTLLRQLTAKVSSRELLWLDGDLTETQRALSEPSLVKLERLVRNFSVIVVDEAQRIANIGLSLKILIDNFPQKTYYVSGSSSLMLAFGLKEPLTGRTQKYRLFPLSTAELGRDLPNYQKKSLLEEQLIFGGYPYLTQVATSQEKINYLLSLIDDYLFRDVLSLQEIAVPENLRRLATLLAFQIGSVVSLNELAQNLNVDVKTVRRYLALLKESFVIFELSSFARNLRNELKKAKKYYFWDLGVRNALINQFLPLNQRTDRGALWENFLILERLKKHEYQRKPISCYFWRNWQQQEIDWLEIDSHGKLAAFEFKWLAKKAHTPKSFFEVYQTKVVQIHQENYLEFLGLKKK